MLRSLWHRVFNNSNDLASSPTDIHRRFLSKKPQRGAAYRDQFNDAIAFAKLVGCHVDSVSWTETSVLERVEPSMIETALRAAGIDDLRDSAGQCIKWSQFIRPYLEDVIECPLYLTIGQLWRNGKPVYAPSWEQLYHWKSEGFRIADFGPSGGGFQLHAWLTLPSGEILDFTLLSSLAAAAPKGWAKAAGQVIGGYPVEVFQGHEFIPMVVGDEYAIRLNEKSPVPFLAETAVDLPIIPMAAILCTG